MAAQNDKNAVAATTTTGREDSLPRAAASAKAATSKSARASALATVAAPPQ